MTTQSEKEPTQQKPSDCIRCSGVGFIKVQAPNVAFLITTMVCPDCHGTGWEVIK